METGVAGVRFKLFDRTFWSHLCQILGTLDVATGLLVVVGTKKESVVFVVFVVSLSSHG